MLTESGTLDRIADVLDQLPNLPTHDRALIFNALEQSTTSLQRPTWTAAQHIDLAAGQTVRPFTLSEAVRWQPWPTFGQIMAGLNFAAGVLT